MSDGTIEDWNPALRREAGQILARALRAESEKSHHYAQTLAPEGRGPGIRYGIYEVTLRHPAREVAYQTLFADHEVFLSRLEDGEPGAIEFALSVAAEVAPEVIVPVSKLLLPHSPWKFLGRALGQALGTMHTEESFELLLEYSGIPYFRDGLSTHGFPYGAERAWEVYRVSGDLADSTLDPYQRAETLPVLSYLLRHHTEEVFPELIRLAKAGDSYAIHALSALPKGREFLLEELAQTEPGIRLNFSQKMAIKLVMEDSPETAIDTLGGMEFLTSSDGRPQLEELLNCLRDDTWRVKRGWLTADLRFAEICVGLKSDSNKEVAGLARDLLRTLPVSAKPKPVKKPRAGAVVAPGIDPKILEEMAKILASLQEMIRTLNAEGYRFAEPKQVLVPPSKADQKAIKDLEKTVAVPPVLKAFWQIVGSVDLRGHHPQWEGSSYLGFEGAVEPALLTDPLVIGSASQVVALALEDQSEPPIRIIIAPDTLAKAGYSGGVLSLSLPQEAIDPRFDELDETFLTHLTRAISFNGFSGLSRKS